MDDSRFDQLSPRHRDVLRLAFARFTTKEMARELGISPGTAKGYCSEAMALLGTRDRRKAAVALHEHEHPRKGEGPSWGVGPGSVERPSNGDGQTAATWLGPLDPRNRKADNNYGTLARIGWFIILVTAIAVGFGSLANGLAVVNGVVAKLSGAR